MKIFGYITLIFALVNCRSHNILLSTYQYKKHKKSTLQDIRCLNGNLILLNQPDSLTKYFYFERPVFLFETLNGKKDTKLTKNLFVPMDDITMVYNSKKSDSFSGSIRNYLFLWDHWDSIKHKSNDCKLIKVPVVLWYDRNWYSKGKLGAWNYYISKKCYSFYFGEINGDFKSYGLLGIQILNDSNYLEYKSRIID